MKVSQKKSLYSERSDYYVEFEDWKSYEKINYMKGDDDMKEIVDIIEKIDKKIMYVVILLIFILIKLFSL